MVLYFYRKIIKTNQQSVKLNLIVADIMGTLLPFKERDTLHARECLFNAFRFGKDVSSQANHRLALWLLQSVKSSTVSHTKLCFLM